MGGKVVFVIGLYSLLMVSWIRHLSSMWSSMTRPCPSQFRKEIKKFHWKWINFVQRFRCTSKLTQWSMGRKHGWPLNTWQFQRIFYEHKVIGPCSIIPRRGSEFLEIRSNSPTKPTHLPWWTWSLTSRLTEELSIKGT